MNSAIRMMLLAAMVGAGGCQPAAQQQPNDMAALRAAMQKHTETLLRIHFKLDNALQEISAAEARAGEGSCDSAGYHAADAYRELQAADDLLLDLGQSLQQQFNLDAASANRN